MSDTPTIEILKFGSRQIEYELTFEERKTLGIKVYPDCSVKVIAPIETTRERLGKKLKEKAPWIIRQQQDFLSFHPLTPARRYVNGETHLYLGKQYRLRIEKGSKNVKLQGGRIIVFTESSKSTESLLDNWYREKARVHFNDILQKVLPFFSRYNLKSPPLQIHYMPTRWGSCTAKGKVLLNPELIKAPKGCIEYVIIHELCHLIHHNHTKAFYEIQESILPDWRKWKERLEELLT